MEIRGAVLLAFAAIGVLSVQQSEPKLDLTVATGPTKSVDGVMRVDSALKSPFHRIPGLAFFHNARDATVKSRIECENICIEKAECEAISFRARDNRCLWSDKKLAYAGGWTMLVKVMRMSDTGTMEASGEYHQLDSMMWRDTNFPPFNAGNLDECKAACTKDPKCTMMSYNVQSKKCLKAADAIEMNPDYIYLSATLIQSPLRMRRKRRTSLRKKRILRPKAKRKRKKRQQSRVLNRPRTPELRPS